MGEYACPKCGKVLKTVQQRKGHLLKHVSEEELVNLVLKNAEEKAKKEESERSGITEGIKGIGDRLDKMDAGFCSRFPELCAKVDRLEEAIPRKLEEGSEEWQAERKADLEHILFVECPNCTPLRDEVLSAKGKRLADIEAEAEEETKVDEEPSADAVVEEPELRTSSGYFSGSKWDEEKELYVEQR